jgi:phthiodiolone/phenolphthiodiolone dimycocerosates ketoreductase
MGDTLSVGIETNCMAPLQLERMSLRLFKMFGVDSFFLPDHYLSFVPRPVWGPEFTPAAKVLPSPDAFFDPFVMMGMMATRYRRVRLGTGVTEPFRRHPATLAQAFVTVDHMTRGRAVLGIGNGERENTEPYGLPFTRRVGRLEEALRIIRALWESRGEPVSIDGPTWRLKNALFTTPLYKDKAPDLWVASHAPRMLGLTGRFADGWYPTNKMTPAEYRERLNRIYAAGAEAGRNLAHFEPAMQIQLVLGSDRGTALAELVKSRTVGAMSMVLPGSVWRRHGLSHPLGEDFEGFPMFVPEEITPEQIETACQAVTPELMGDGVIAGNLEEVEQEVRGFVEAGLRHLIIWNIGPLAKGASLGELFRLAVLIRRLRRIALPSRFMAASPSATRHHPGPPAAPPKETDARLPEAS